MSKRGAARDKEHSKSEEACHGKQEGEPEDQQAHFEPQCAQVQDQYWRCDQGSGARVERKQCGSQEA